jgi:hypothetical protein
MRSDDDVYWTTSLPKDHEALLELDAYCADWGRLTRAEATRRLLIEWVKVRKGESIAGWGPRASSQVAAISLSPGARRAAGESPKSSLSNRAARAASQVLDE